MKDGEIQNKLSPAQVSVMRHKVTEPPYFGKFWDHFEAGTYRCAACNTALFSSDDKFDAKTGWPTFKKPLSERDVQFKSEPGPDDKVEIRCRVCKSHLGYVIPNDPPYYRVNSVCLTFEEREIPEIELPEKEEKGEEKESATAVRDDMREEKSMHAAGAASALTASHALSIPSLAAGAAIGVVLGAAGALYYCSLADAVAPIPDMATSTATSTLATTTPQEPPAGEPQAPREEAVEQPAAEPAAIQVVPQQSALQSPQNATGSADGSI